MPATTPNPAKSDLKGFEKANGNAPVFVRCDLNKADRERLAMWADELEDQDVLLWMYDRVESGHTISIRCNDVGYQCSVTGVREASGHKNLSLIGRASTPLRALQSVMFRDQVMLEGRWPQTGKLDELDF